MAANINIKVYVGAGMSVQISGQNCKEIVSAMDGYEELNKVLDGMFGDLAELVYPEGMEQTSMNDSEADDEV